jgi:hypothetical protein
LKNFLACAEGSDLWDAKILRAPSNENKFGLFWLRYDMRLTRWKIAKAYNTHAKRIARTMAIPELPGDLQWLDS